MVSRQQIHKLKLTPNTKGTYACFVSTRDDIENSNYLTCSCNVECIERAINYNEKEVIRELKNDIEKRFVAKKN